eukprot:3940153-Alexandrium_andersonii.AAC.1
MKPRCRCVRRALWAPTPDAADAKERFVITLAVVSKERRCNTRAKPARNTPCAARTEIKRARVWRHLRLQRG